MADTLGLRRLNRTPSGSSTFPVISWASILFCACSFSSSGFVEVSEINLEAVPSRSAMRITDVAMGREGIVYICDRTRSLVYRVSTNENKADVIRPNALDNGNTWRPSAVAVGKEGMLYVATENKVWIFNAEGRGVTRVGTRIAHPTSISVRDDGTMYVAGKAHDKYVLHWYGHEGEDRIIYAMGRPDHDARGDFSVFWGAMVRAWERGLLFGTDMPFELVALEEDGDVIKSRLRPALNLDPKIDYDESLNTATIQVFSLGKGLSIASNDSLIYYCFTPDETGLYTDISSVYVDVYNRNLESVAKDIKVVGVIVAADNDGYVYFAKKNRKGMDGLFRGKLKYRSTE